MCCSAGTKAFEVVFNETNKIKSHKESRARTHTVNKRWPVCKLFAPCVYISQETLVMFKLGARLFPVTSNERIRHLKPRGRVLSSPCHYPCDQWCVSQRWAPTLFTALIRAVLSDCVWMLRLLSSAPFIEPPRS